MSSDLSTQDTAIMLSRFYPDKIQLLNVQALEENQCQILPWVALYDNWNRYCASEFHQHINDVMKFHRLEIRADMLQFLYQKQANKKIFLSEEEPKVLARIQAAIKRKRIILEDELFNVENDELNYAFSDEVALL